MTSRVLYVGTFVGDATTRRNRSYNEDLADRLEARGMTVTRTSARFGRAARLADMLYTTWAKRHAYDVAVVSVFSGAAFIWAEAVCFELRRLRKPYVLALHGGLLHEFAKRWPRRVRRLLATAAVVAAPSAFLRDRMSEYHDDIIILPNAVDAQSYSFRLRAQPRPHLVWLRAFHEIYNPSLAIDVVVGLAHEFPELELSMIGPDKDGSRAAVEARAREAGVAERVHFVGGVAHHDVARYLDGADVFLNTTNVDNTPVSVLEAAASGLCLVSTAVGGIPFLLGHDRNALLVPPRDPSAMCAAVERVLHEPGLGERLSRGARELAIEHDWSGVLTRWEHTLEQVAHG
ncbi:MAG TPA: glycosyltransferase family 4 protein [Kofleriaceae bacterium]